MVSLATEDGRRAAVAEAHQEVRLPPQTAPSVLRRLGFVALVPMALAATVATALWTLSTLGWTIFFLALVGGAAGTVALLLSPMLQDDEPALPPGGELVVRPHGVALLLRPAEELPSHRGTVKAAGEAAQLVELHAAGGLTLRDAVSHGFQVELEDGRRLIVPAGRIRFVAAAGSLSRMTASSVRAYLAAFDPLRAGSTEEPFPHDRGHSLVLRNGDPVTVRAERFDEAWKEEGGYRERSGATLHPRGMVWLEPAR